MELVFIVVVLAIYFSIRPFVVAYLKRRKATTRNPN